MKIESIIRRAGGTKLSIGKTDYHFAEGDDGRHVCEVEDENHADRLLSIKEGFRLVDEQSQAPEPVPAPVPDVNPVAVSEPEPEPEPAAEQKVAAKKPGSKAKAA